MNECQCPIKPLFNPVLFYARALCPVWMINGLNKELRSWWGGRKYGQQLKEICGPTRYFLFLKNCIWGQYWDTRSWCYDAIYDTWASVEEVIQFYCRNSRMKSWRDNLYLKVLILTTRTQIHFFFFLCWWIFFKMLKQVSILVLPWMCVEVFPT